MAESERALPPVDFSSFVVSLASSAMAHLGEGPHPAGGGVDLTLAKQTIDLLGVLQAKTKGNLDGDEAKLLETLLYELRTRFMAKSGA